MCSNRRRSHRAHMVLADVRWRIHQRERLHRKCQRAQDSAVLERCGFWSDGLSTRQLSGLRLPRADGSDALRNRASKNRILRRTYLRGWPAGKSGHLSNATRNCPNRSGWRSGELGVALDRRHRSLQFVWHRMHLRQRVTQVLAKAPGPGACLGPSVPMPRSEKDNRSPRRCESVNVSSYFAMVANGMSFNITLQSTNLVDQVASLRS